MTFTELSPMSLLAGSVQHTPGLTGHATMRVLAPNTHILCTIRLQCARVDSFEDFLPHFFVMEEHCTMLYAVIVGGLVLSTNPRTIFHNHYIS